MRTRTRSAGRRGRSGQFLAVIAFVIGGAVVAGLLSAVWFFDWFSGRAPTSPASPAADPAWELRRLFLSGLVGVGVAFTAFGLLNGVRMLLAAARRHPAGRR